MKSVATIISAVLMCCIISCDTPPGIPAKRNFDDIHKEIQLMMDSVSKDIGRNGPIQWIKYFEDTPGFYMASEGKLVFPNYNAAQKFIRDTLVRKVSGIVLDWQNTNIDSIGENTVAINTYYHEDIMIVNDSVMHETGYCTAIADLTNAGWKFRSLHWSVSK